MNFSIEPVKGRQVAQFAIEHSLPKISGNLASNL